MSLKRAKHVRFKDSVRVGPLMTVTRTSIAENDRWQAYVDIGCEVVVIDPVARSVIHINWSEVRDFVLADGDYAEVKKLWPRSRRHGRRRRRRRV